MHERIKEIRESMNLNQSEFAKLLGMGQSTLGMMEVGKRNILDRHIKTICSICNVNEEWLKYGFGEMFVENDSSIITELASEYNLDSKGVKFIESFLKLTPEQRSALQELATNFANALSKDDEVTATKQLTEDEIINYEVDAYRQELVAEQKGEIYSASESIKGNSKGKNLA